MSKGVSLLAGLILATFVLADCAPVVAPIGVENDTPMLDGDVFLTRDGLRLPLRHWDTAHPRAVIVALHGMSDYSNAFDMPAAWWAEQGITTYAYDQRGFGKAPNIGIWPGSKALRDDFADCVDAVRVRSPGVPVFALGESMGGAVVLSTLADENPPRVDGVILVAPAVWSREDMPLAYRAVLWLTAHTMPGLQLSGRGLKIWPSDNIEMMRKLSRDPLFQKKTRADAVWGFGRLDGFRAQSTRKVARNAAYPLYLRREGSDHSARTDRSRRKGTGSSRRGARISGRLSHVAARSRRAEHLERCRDVDRRKIL